MDKFELEELAKDVAEKVKALVQEGNVTRVRIRKDDTVILNLPMTAGVVGTPGAGFGRNGEGFFRLTAFGDADKTAEAMERIRKATF